MCFFFFFSFSNCCCCCFSLSPPTLSHTVNDWTQEQEKIIEHQRNVANGTATSPTAAGPAKTNAATKGAPAPSPTHSATKRNPLGLAKTPKQLRPHGVHFKFADVEPVACIGRGAFGFVHLVSHAPTGETFALKTLQKAEVVARGQQAMVIAERDILHRIDHPFVCSMVETFQDEDCLYMMMELLQGGDVYSALSATEELRFGARRSRFYVAGVTEALHAVHAADVMFRDLKPENLVLHRSGYVKLVDFGCAKISRHSFTLCGTPDYIAPEIILGKGHGIAVDWWALGVVLFEFRFGDLPFSGASPTATYTNILQRIMDVPSPEEYGADLDPGSAPAALEALVKGLLTVDLTQRIGCSHEGANDVRTHPWFSEAPDGDGGVGFDWSAFRAQTMAVPYVPELGDAQDVSAFTDSDAPAEIAIKPYGGEAGGDQAWCAGF